MTGFVATFILVRRSVRGNGTEHWRILRDGRVFGTVTSAELQSMAKLGLLRPTDQLHRNDLATPVSVSALSDLLLDDGAAVDSNPNSTLRSGSGLQHTGADDEKTTSSRFHAQRVWLLIAAGIGVLSTFLPWVEFPIGSWNGTYPFPSFQILVPGIAPSWVTLACFATIMLVAGKGEHGRPLRSGGRAVVITSTTIAMSVVGWIQISVRRDEDAVAWVNIGFGAGSAIGAGVGCLIALIAFGAFSPTQKQQPGWNRYGGLILVVIYVLALLRKALSGSLGQ